MLVCLGECWEGGGDDVLSANRPHWVCREPRSRKPGAGIMEADDRQVTTNFTVQPSFHHLLSTNRVS